MREGGSMRHVRSFIGIILSVSILYAGYNMVTSIYQKATYVKPPAKARLIAKVCLVSVKELDGKVPCMGSSSFPTMEECEHVANFYNNKMPIPKIFKGEKPNNEMALLEPARCEVI